MFIINYNLYYNNKLSTSLENVTTKINTVFFIFYKHKKTKKFKFKTFDCINMLR